MGVNDQRAQPHPGKLFHSGGDFLRRFRRHDVLKAHRPEHGGRVDFKSHGGLTAHRFMRTVVVENVFEIGARFVGGDAEGTHMHDKGAVAVDAVDVSSGAERHAERDRGGMPHSADGEEVPGVALPPRLPDLKDLAGCLAGGGYDEILLRYAVQHEFQRVLAGKGIVRPRRLRLKGGEGAFAHDDGEGLAARLHIPHGAVDLRSVVVLENLVFNAHRVEQRERDLALLLVLGLVLGAGFPAPADHQQQGNGIYFLVGDGEQGIDGVAFAAVLHIHHADMPCGNVVSACDADGVALVGGDDVAVLRRMLPDAGADVGQQRIRHACKEIQSVGDKIIVKFLGVDHGQNLSVLIGNE